MLVREILSPEKIKGYLNREVKKAGIARPGPREFLMDALSFAPAMLGMPVVSPLPVKSKLNYKALRRADNRFIRRVERWLRGKGKRPAAPGKVYRGIPKGAEPKPGTRYTHGTPWGYNASRGGKGAFGDPRSHDVYQHSASPDTLYYRGGSLAGDPFETGKIMSAQGMTWDKILDKGKRLYKRGVRDTDKYGKNWEAKRVADQIKRASFEVDIGNKPGIWRQKIVPKDLRHEIPVMRHTDDLKEVVNKARKSGMPESHIAELPESLILNRHIPKKGDIVKSPVGKVRYDGIQPGWEHIPESYSYTFQDGIAAGGSFTSPSHKLKDIEKSGKKILKVWEKNK